MSTWDLTQSRNLTTRTCFIRSKDLSPTHTRWFAGMHPLAQRILVNSQYISITHPRDGAVQARIIPCDILDVSCRRACFIHNKYLSLTRAMVVCRHVLLGHVSPLLWSTHGVTMTRDCLSQTEMICRTHQMFVTNSLSPNHRVTWLINQNRPPPWDHHSSQGKVLP